jgi:hypothetical protein
MQEMLLVASKNGSAPPGIMVYIDSSRMSLER